MKTKIFLLSIGLMFNSVMFAQSQKANTKVVAPVTDVTQNVNLTTVKFDTQDNLFLKDFDCHNWQNQGGLDEGEAINQFSGRRIAYKGVDALRVRTTVKSKRVFLNHYPFFYKVKKISEKEFILISKKFNDYFDNTDIVEVLIFQ